MLQLSLQQIHSLGLIHKLACRHRADRASGFAIFMSCTAMQGSNLLLDTPDDVARDVWSLLGTDNPRALLHLETTSKAVRHQLHCVAVQIRFAISYEQHRADHAALTQLLDSSKLSADHPTMVDMAWLDRLEATFNAVAACQASMHQRHSLRQSVLEHYGYALSPECLAFFEKMEIQTQQEVLQACDEACLIMKNDVANFRRLMGYRDLAASGRPVVWYGT